MNTPATMVLSVVLILATSQACFAFSTKNQMRVNAVDSVVWEVVPRRASSAQEYWCAASDYVNRGLGLSWNTQIFVARGLGVSETTGRRSSVQFTVDPSAAGIEPTSSFILNSFRVGDHMSANRALSFCRLEPRFF